MSLLVVDRNSILNDDLRALLERRLRYALSRFDSRIRHTTAVFEDVNGPRGGIDKHCRITVTLQPAGEIVVRVHEADLSKCITHAADRIGRAVTRAIERTQPASRNGHRDAGSP